jgi:hypothetical protein
MAWRRHFRAGKVANCNQQFATNAVQIGLSPTFFGRLNLMRGLFELFQPFFRATSLPKGFRKGHVPCRLVEKAARGAQFCASLCQQLGCFRATAKRDQVTCAMPFCEFLIVRKKPVLRAKCLQFREMIQKDDRIGFGMRFATRNAREYDDRCGRSVDLAGPRQRLITSHARPIYRTKLGASRNGPVKSAVRIRKGVGYQNNSESKLRVFRITASRPLLSYSIIYVYWITSH